MGFDALDANPPIYEFYAKEIQTVAINPCLDVIYLHAENVCIITSLLTYLHADCTQRSILNISWKSDQMKIFYLIEVSSLIVKTDDQATC